MLIVNALGGFGNPNAPRDAPAPRRRRTISDRGHRRRPRLRHERGQRDARLCRRRRGAVRADDPRDRPAGTRGCAATRPTCIKVLTAADILRARREGRIGVIYGFQNAAMMGERREPRRHLRRSRRARHPAHLQSRQPDRRRLDGAAESRPHAVRPRGDRAAERATGSWSTCRTAASAPASRRRALSRQPISINHTGCRALTDLPRNKSDEELRLVAERGGFVGIYFMPFLSPDSVADAEDVVAHIDHAVNVCGEDHVGIGTDGGTTGDRRHGRLSRPRRAPGDRRAPRRRHRRRRRESRHLAVRRAS